MMKKYKSYLILIGALILLIGAYFVIDRLEGEGGENPSFDLKNTEPVFSISREEIAAAKIQNQSGTYTLSFEEPMRILALPLEQAEANKIESLTYEITEFRPESIVAEKGENLSVYGLDQETISMTIRSKSGEETKIIIGSPSPIGNGYYGRLSNQDGIYIFATYKAELFLRDVSYYRKKEGLTIDKNNISEFAVEKNNGYHIRFVKNKVESTDTPNNIFAAYRMVSPYNWDAEGSEVSKVLDSVVGLTPEEFIADSLAEQEQYGFTPYQYKIVIRQENGTTDTIYLGKAYGNKYYMKLNDKNAIYGIANTAFGYLTLEPTAFLQKFAFIKNLDTVAKINYRHGNQAAIFDIQKISEEAHDIKKDGKNISESTFKQFYTELISITTNGPASFTPSDAPIASYEFTYTNGASDQVAYYAMDFRRVAISVNGVIQFYVNSNELNQRLTAMDEILARL